MLIKKIFITFLVFFSISSYAKNIGIINNIEFKGLHNISKSEALKSIIFNVGNKVSENDIKNSINSLFKTGKFEDIKVMYAKKNIIFYVQEKPIISDVIFSGNSIIKNSILNAYLKKLNIQTGGIFNQFFIDVFIKTIENFYYNIGRFESNIQVIKNFSKDDNSVSLKIFINEGVIKKINSIKILGVKNFSQEQISELFESKDHSVWWNFLDKCLYSPKIFNQDLQRLSNFYLNHGYFYFHINNTKIDFVKNENKVNIIIDISEGKKYRIAKFFINGNILPYQVLDIEKLIKINTYEVYNKEKISNIVNDIKRFLSDNGYIDAIVIAKPKINNHEKIIFLDFNIDIKKRFFVHRIHFIGNSTTKDQVLRREIKQMEGKYINSSLIELGKQSLQKTKYFSNVEIIKKIYSFNSHQLDIFYRVQEQPTGSINFGLGYGIDSGISVNTSLSKDNIFGSGNSFKASIIKNKNQKYADISIIYPYFMSNIQELNTRVFYNDFKYNFNSIANLAKKTYGIESSIGVLINNFNKMNIGFGYTHNGINNKEKVKDSANFSKTSLDKNFLKNSIVNDLTLNYSWLHSTLKYLSFPISGNQIYISGKNTIPGSDNNFYKFILDSENYFPINKRQNFIFLSHVHLGIGNVFTEDKFPFYENFYANNESNIRGFRLNTIGPKRIYDISDSKSCVGYLNNNICESIDSIGGNLTFTSNLELITPIPFIDNKYTESFRTSVFLDIGNIWDTKLFNDKNIDTFLFFKKNILNNIYSSIGISLKWLSPIGPLSFSYSLPMQTDKNYQLEPFQFNFGKNW